MKASRHQRPEEDQPAGRRRGGRRARLAAPAQGRAHPRDLEAVGGLAHHPALSRVGRATARAGAA